MKLCVFFYILHFCRILKVFMFCFFAVYYIYEWRFATNGAQSDKYNGYNYLQTLKTISTDCKQTRKQVNKTLYPCCLSLNVYQISN